MTMDYELFATVKNFLSKGDELIARLELSHDKNGGEERYVFLRKGHVVVLRLLSFGSRCFGSERGWWPCVYVGVPAPVHKEGVDPQFTSMNVHGGITFNGKLAGIDNQYFYGVDFNHSCDYTDTEAELVGQVVQAVDDLIKTVNEDLPKVNPKDCWNYHDDDED